MSADKCSSLRRLYENILIDSLFSWNQVWISDCNQTLDSFSCDISHAIYKTMWHRYSIVSHFHQRVIWIDAYFFSGTGLGSTDELSQSAARVFCFTATAFDLYWLSSNNCGEEFNPRVAARSFCYLWFQTFLCLSLRPSGTSLHFHRAFCKEIIFFSSNFIDSSDCERYLFVVADCPFTAGKECENTLEITLSDPGSVSLWEHQQHTGPERRCQISREKQADVDLSLDVIVSLKHLELKIPSSTQECPLY